MLIIPSRSYSLICSYNLDMAGSIIQIWNIVLFMPFMHANRSICLIVVSLAVETIRCTKPSKCDIIMIPPGLYYPVGTF
jgi:hypothetical protein